MSVPELLGSSWNSLIAVVIATLAIYATVIAAARLWGLRSFSKMSSADFAATVATGSILAATAVNSVPLVVGVLAIAVLFLAQAVVSAMRRRNLSHVVDNSPLMLMHGRTILEENMAAAQITRDDLMAKLRESNVISLDEVRFVVLEATGDVSVLHADPDGPPVSSELVEGVRGWQDSPEPA